MKQLFRLFVILSSLCVLASSCQQAPFLTLNGTRTFNFTRDSGTQSFTFTCNRDWSASCTESWVTLSPSSGSAADEEITVKITCAANTTYDVRSAVVTVRLEDMSESITITQDTGMGLIVSPTILNLTNAAQTIDIEVQKNVQYSITIDDAGKSWITHTGTKGLSSEKASFSIAANDSYDDREAKITFKQTDGSLSETVVVRQSQTNGLFITTPEYNLSNEAHTLTVEVKANVEFEVTSQADWVKYVSTSTKALTPSQITLEVAANETYDDREGIVIVKQKGGDLVGTITIRQDENYGILVSEESVSISKEEQKVVVEVKYNVDFEVIIPSEAQGTMISSVEYSDGDGGTKALSARTYRFNVTENKTYDARKASITFKQKDGSLSGTFTITQQETKTVLVSKNHFDIQPEGGTFDVKVKYNVPYTVEIKDVTWIEQVSTKALSEQTISFSVSENTQSEERQGIIVISADSIGAKEEITITQYGSGFYKGDVVIMSMADLEGFNASNTVVIDGDLLIKNTGWTETIAINNTLQKVSGTIQIEGEAASISGLENLAFCNSIKLINCSQFSVLSGLSELPGDFYYSYLEPNISSFEGMEWLTKVGGSFSILSPDSYNGFSKIITFRGFDNLESVQGNFTIRGFFSNLQSFSGFEELKSVGGDFVISSSGYNCYPKLNNFMGFNSLKSISGDFKIGCGMRNVTSFVGMDALTFIGGDVVFIDNWGGNSLLSSLTSFKGWENVEEIGGALFRGGSISGPVPIQSFSDLKSLKKLGGLYIGNHPSLDVNSFAQLPINRIGKKGIIIQNNSIADLYFLRNIEVIEGELTVTGQSLTNWKGLSKLKQVGILSIGSSGGYFYSLNSTEGLSSVVRVGVLRIASTDVQGQFETASLKGLENLEIIDDELSIYNTTLGTLEELRSLRSIGASKEGYYVLSIGNNANLCKFNALRAALQSLLETGVYQDVYQLQNKCSIYGNKYNPLVEDILNGNGDMD